MLRIGLAMLQGARTEHVEALHDAAKELGIEIKVIFLRRSTDVKKLNAIVLPGGESTAMSLASKSENLFAKIWEHIEEKRIPVLATCAGAILLSENGIIDADIDRNAYGRQIDSFQSSLEITLEMPSVPTMEHNVQPSDKFGHKPLDMWSQAGELSADFIGVFIRAPRFSNVRCDAVVLRNDEIVGVLDDNKLALTFHPELTRDRRFHRWLLIQAGGV